MNTLIVFAKAPLPGLAKTRLAAVLGAEGAAALALHLLQHAVAQAALVVKDLGAAAASRLELCVTPDVQHPAFQALRQAHRLQLTLQGEGDLGQRMDRALTRALAATPPGSGATRPRVLLMGSDAPALRAPVLHAALRALDSADAVFVPARDGGYVLVGLCREAPMLFEGMTWSTPQVMQHTRVRAAAAGLRVAELAPLPDIDEPADLIHVPEGWLDGLRA